MQIPVTNTGETNLHIAGRVITPGSTRMVEESLAPDHLRPAAGQTAAAGGADTIADLLAQAEADVIAALPSLSDDDLYAAYVTETDGRDRVDLLNALMLERKRRVIEPFLDATVPEIEERLRRISSEALPDVEFFEKQGKDRKGVHEAIEEERLRRAQNPD